MSTEDRKQQAAQIRPRRLALGWTQEELADKAGVSLGTVGNAENGTTIPQPGRLGMMLDALAEGEREAASRPSVLDDADRDEMARWLHETMTVPENSTRKETSKRFADVHDALRGTPQICWTLLDLDVDIEVIRRLVDEATEAFIASGSYVALSHAGIKKADEFLAENAALLADINQRKSAGRFGRPSFISKMTERARREGFNAGMDEAFRRGVEAARAEDRAAVASIGRVQQELTLTPEDVADLAPAARKVGREPGLTKRRREHDEATEAVPEDPTGMEPI